MSGNVSLNYIFFSDPLNPVKRRSGSLPELSSTFGEIRTHPHAQKQGLQGNSERLRKNNIFDDDNNSLYYKRSGDTQEKPGFVSLNVPLN
ncbi:hypothetical protein UY416_25935 [Paenibacillus polymyxa]|uniref:hypothetical protein n=1 Tax=Paenibacillus polymyxa TaxID=1406 RepID=UPI002AB3DEED|nr:hypothetical protein [Paenibacillus polymyxa]MDY8049717.1 hypothetical protein [Paenibacillus polymyxa]